MDAAVRRTKKTKAQAQKKGKKQTKKTAVVVKRGYISEKTTIPEPANGIRMERWGVCHKWLAANSNDANFADDENDEHPPPNWTAQGNVEVKAKMAKEPEGRGSASDSSQSGSSSDSSSGSE